ncbi:Coiled-coil domain-containing protein 91, partial [Galemys pyrenaicus]
RREAGPGGINFRGQRCGAAGARAPLTWTAGRRRRGRACGRVRARAAVSAASRAAAGLRKVGGAPRGGWARLGRPARGRGPGGERRFRRDWGVTPFPPRPRGLRAARRPRLPGLAGWRAPHVPAARASRRLRASPRDGGVTQVLAEPACPFSAFPSPGQARRGAGSTTPPLPGHMSLSSLCVPDVNPVGLSGFRREPGTLHRGEMLRPSASPNVYLRGNWMMAFGNLLCVAWYSDWRGVNTSSFNIRQSIQYLLRLISIEEVQKSSKLAFHLLAQAGSNEKQSHEEEIDTGAQLGLSLLHPHSSIAAEQSENHLTEEQANAAHTRNKVQRRGTLAAEIFDSGNGETQTTSPAIPWAAFPAVSGVHLSPVSEIVLDHDHTSPPVGCLPESISSPENTHADNSIISQPVPAAQMQQSTHTHLDISLFPLGLTDEKSNGTVALVDGPEAPGANVSNRQLQQEISSLEIKLKVSEEEKQRIKKDVESLMEKHSLLEKDFLKEKEQEAISFQDRYKELQ